MRLCLVVHYDLAQGSRRWRAPTALVAPSLVVYFVTAVAVVQFDSTPFDVLSSLDSTRRVVRSRRRRCLVFSLRRSCLETLTVVVVVVHETYVVLSLTRRDVAPSSSSLSSLSSKASAPSTCRRCPVSSLWSFFCVRPALPTALPLSLSSSLSSCRLDALRRLFFLDSTRRPRRRRCLVVVLRRRSRC